MIGEKQKRNDAGQIPDNDWFVNYFVVKECEKAVGLISDWI